MAVEKFKDLDRNLAAAVKPVAQQRRGKLPVGTRFGEIAGNADDLGHGVAQEEVILRDLVEPAHAAEQAQYAAHVFLVLAEHVTDVAHTRRTEARFPAEQRLGPA